MFNMTDRIVTTMLILGITACFCTPATADFIHYGQAERDAWFEALPDARTITFQEHPEGGLDRLFYEESHGVVFSTLTVGALVVEHDPSWVLDGHGLAVNAPLGSLIMSFTEPMTAFAGDFSGIFVSYEVYSKGVLIGFGDWPISPPADFQGFISTMPFDEIRLEGHSSFLGVDDLHFAPFTIPAPGAACVLVLLGAIGGRRRR